MKSAVAEVTAFIYSIKALTGFVKSSVAAFAQYESIQTNLGVVLKSTKLAADEFQRLKEMAAKTPFDTAGLAGAATQLHAVGVSSKEIIPTLTMLGDSAMGDNEKLQRIIANYAQIMSVGKASAIDMKQFAQMGLPVYDLMQKMGVQGQATAEQVKQMFQNMTSEGGMFYKGMEQGSKTLSGQINTLKDNFKDLQIALVNLVNGGEGSKTLINSLSAGIENISKWLDKINTLNAARSASIDGTATNEQRLMWLQQELKLAQDKLAKDNRLASTNSSSYVKSDVNNDIVKIDNLRLAIGALNQQIELENKYQTENEEITNRLSKSQSDYATALEYIDSQYKETDTGRLKDIQDQIDKLEKMKTVTKEVAVAHSDFDPYAPKTAKVGLTDQYKKEIDDVIAYLSKKLEEAKNSMLSGWREALKKAFGFTDDDNKYLVSGDVASRAFISRSTNTESRNKELGMLMGNSQIDADLESAKKSLEAYKNALQALYDYNGINPFTSEDSAIKNLVQSYLGASAAVKKLEQDKKDAESIDGLNKQNEAYRKIINSAEEYETKLLRIQATQAGISDEKIDDWIKAKKENMSLERTAQNPYAYQNMNAQGYGKAALSAAADGTTGDVSTFLKSYAQTGNWLIAVINTVIGAIINVAKECDNFDRVMSPVTRLFEKAKPFIQFILDAFEVIEDIMDSCLTPVMALLNMIGAIGQLLKPIVTFITKVLLLGHVFDWLKGLLEDWGLISSDLSSEQQSEAERLKELNAQYESLASSMKELEEYYRSERTSINSKFENWLVEHGQTKASDTKVDDMIITPQGNFSTHPDDYIAAFKNPDTLSGDRSSGTTVKMSVVIKNEYGSSAEVSTSTETDTDGVEKLFIVFSKKTAADYAEGKNGWDNAVFARNARVAGRQIS